MDDFNKTQGKINDRLRNTVIVAVDPTGWIEVYGCSHIRVESVILDDGERFADEVLNAEQLLRWQGRGRYRIRPDASDKDLLWYLLKQAHYRDEWTDHVLSKITDRAAVDGEQQAVERHRQHAVAHRVKQRRAAR